MEKSSSEKAAYARPFWNAATRQGTLDATTTFHEQFNKRDYRYSYGRCGDFVRQSGMRGMALGYLTKVRFTRFLSTPLAADLTGVDLTRPGQSADQAARVIVVADAFFELLVRYSRSHPFRDGDYGNVARSRKLPDGSFCIFTGFQEALASRELQSLREGWRQQFVQPPPPPPPPPSAPPPPPPASAPPPPPPAPPTRLADDPHPLEAELVAEYERAASTPDHVATSLEFSASGCYIAHEAPLYVVQLKRKRRGASGGAVAAVVIAKGALRKRLGVAALWSAVEIRSAFGRKKGYS
jgi:hypothetical protein